MNFYRSALITQSCIGVWDTYLLLRQRRSYNSTAVPEPFKESISEEVYKVNQQYNKDKGTFEIFEHVKDTIIGIAKVVGKFSSFLYRTVAEKTKVSSSSFSHCLLYSIADDVITTLIKLPSAYYATFVIEEKHGFNKMTKKQFFLDTLKSFALRVTLLHPTVTWLIRFTVNYFGDKFPLYFCGLSVSLLMVFIFIYPTFIQPLFNTFTPLDESSPIFAKISAVATKMNYPLKKVFIVDGSRQSAHSNAYMYGFGKNKRLVLYDTLIEQMKGHEDCIAAVFCHEIGHWKHNHTSYFFGISVLQMLAIAYGARSCIFNSDLYTQFGFSEKLDPVIGFELYSLVFLEPVMQGISYMLSFVSRKFEFQADRTAVQAGYGKDLRQGLILLHLENKANLVPDPLYATLTMSHPTVMERINAIDAAEKKEQ